MATRAEFEALMQQRLAEGDIEKANRIRTEKLGLPPIDRPTAPNNDPQLQPDSGWQEAGNILQSLPGHAMNFAGEAASAFNRSTMQGLDFFGPGTANAGLRLVGSDRQLPTFEGGFDQLPGAAGGFMAPGLTRDVVRGASGAAPAALGGYPVAGRNVASPLGAAFDFLGLGTSAPQAGVAPLAFSGMPAALPTYPATSFGEFLPERPSQMKLDRLVGDGSESVQRAGYALDSYTGRATADQAGRDSMKQGIDPSLVSMIEAANPETKSKLSAMLDNLGRGREFLREKSTGRPSNVLGDAILSRYQIVRDANRAAGSRMDEVVNSLKGEKVDVSPAVGQFVERIKGMGIDLETTPDGLTAAFKGSDIEGLDGIITGLKRVLGRMYDTKAPDAHDVHRLKKYIDETVTYGKSAEGLSGKTERALKELRNGLDSILDQQFPAYNEVNSQYSETIGALDALQGVAGSKMDLMGKNADKALGTLMRRWASNAQSRVPLMDATTELDRLAKKYSSGAGKNLVPYRGALSTKVPDVSDDIETQVQFLSQLERQFGSSADNSFMGDIGKANDRAAETMIDAVTSKPTVLGVLADSAKWGYKKVRGINEENALKAMRELVGGK